MPIIPEDTHYENAIIGSSHESQEIFKIGKNNMSQQFVTRERILSSMEAYCSELFSSGGQLLGAVVNEKGKHVFKKTMKIIIFERCGIYHDHALKVENGDSVFKEKELFR